MANARVAGRHRHDVEGPLDVLREGRRQPDRQLLEGGREVGVVLVGVADHQPRRQDDGHRLGLGQLERRQERPSPGRCPTPALGPQRDDLLVDGLEVAVDGPDRHADPLGEVGRAHAVGVRLEDAHQTGHPGEPVALRAVPSSVSSSMVMTPEDRRRGRGPVPSRSGGRRRSARMVLRARCRSPRRWRSPATWPSSPSMKTQ